MPVAKSSLRSFTSRERISYDYMKNYSWVDIEKAVNDLGVFPDFATFPYQHQYACFLLGLWAKRFFYMLDMGVGKTKIIIDLVSYLRSINPEFRCLVGVPYTTIKKTWVDEVEKHAPHLRVCSVEGPEEERKDLLEDWGNHICVTSYAGLNRLCSGLVDGKYVWDKKKCADVANEFDMFVADESTALMSSTSLSFKVAKAISKDLDYVYCLSGTPFGKNPIALWSQFFIVDRGETLGETLGLFRETFCKSRTSYAGFPEWHFDKRKTDKLSQFVKNRSIRYRDDECLDLPEIKEITVPVKRTAEFWEHYRARLQSIKKHKNDRDEVRNIFIEMRYLSSGILPIVDEETGEREYIELECNPKLEAVLEKVQEFPDDEQLIIACFFRRSVARVCRELDNLRITNEGLDSKTRDKEKVLSYFQRKVNRVLVATESAAYGLNLQENCRYMLFYESPVCPMKRQQYAKRIHRSGQERKCFYYDFVVERSVDERILKSVQEGKDLLSDLIDGTQTI
jgi:SNF2 family DNA or RNA helicase